MCWLIFESSHEETLIFGGAFVWGGIFTKGQSANFSLMDISDWLSQSEDMLDIDSKLDLSLKYVIYLLR